MLKKIKKELDDITEAREKAIKVQRQIVPLCAKAIRAIHAGKYLEAAKAVEGVRKLIKKCEKILKKYPKIVDAVLSSSYQEYAELAIFLSYTKTKRLPELEVPPKFYLLGLGDCIGELKRIGMKHLAKGDLQSAEKLQKELEDLYFELSKYIYPNAIVPGLKRKQDVARKVLNDYNNMIMSFKIARK